MYMYVVPNIQVILSHTAQIHMYKWGEGCVVKFSC